MTSPVAFILVGGKGSRLQSVVSDVPKPLASIGGEPFLYILLRSLKKEGVSRVVLLTGYKAELIEQACGNGSQFGLEIIYSVESFPLGTGGAAKLAEKYVASDGSCLLINGDTFIESSVSEVLSFKPSIDCPVGMGVMPVSNVERFGKVEFDNNKTITSLSEKTASGYGFVNSGIYHIHKSVLSNMVKEKFISFENDTLPILLEKKNSLKVIPLSGEFFDIGLPSSYGRFNADIILQSLRTVFLKEMLLLFLQQGRLFVDNDFADEAHEIKELLLSEGVEVVQGSSAVLKEKLRNTASSRDIVMTSNEELCCDLLKEFPVKIIGGAELSLNSNIIAFPDNFSLVANDLVKALKVARCSKGLFEFSKSYSRQALFLDRDGVVIKFVNYISRASDVEVLSDAVDLIKRANRAGIPVFIVTNQSGIGRGYYSYSDYYSVDREMKRQLASNGCFVDEVLFSDYYEESLRSNCLAGRSRRKPGSGMLTEVARRHHINLETSLMAGDKASDVWAGYNGGIKKLYLKQGNEEQDIISELTEEMSTCKLIENLKEIPI